MITKEMLNTWKKANDSVVVWINDDKATIGFNTKVKVKGFQDTTVHAEFNGFNATLPNGYKKACTSTQIYTWNGNSGNFGALRLLLKEGDELSFTVTDNTNDYMKAVVIPAENLNKDKENSFPHPTYYGLHNDTMYVNIKRKGKYILRDFVLDCRQCPDNSARMLVR